MRLLALPQEVQWLIEQGNLSAGHGRALLALPTPEEQIAFAEEIMAHHWSVRETEERIRRILHQMNQPDEPKEDAPLKIYFQEAERKLTADLGRKVTISQGKKKGKIALEYYDQEDLELLKRVYLHKEGLANIAQDLGTTRTALAKRVSRIKEKFRKNYRESEKNLEPEKNLAQDREKTPLAGHELLKGGTKR